MKKKSENSTPKIGSDVLNSPTKELFEHETAIVEKNSSDFNAKNAQNNKNTQNKIGEENASDFDAKSSPENKNPLRTEVKNTNGDSDGENTNDIDAKWYRGVCRWFNHVKGWGFVNLGKLLPKSQEFV